MQLLYDFLVSYGMCLLGLVCHWGKKYYRGQTRAWLWCYLKHRFWSSTLPTLFSLALANAAALSSITDLYSLQTLGILMVVGSTVDSYVNTTPEQSVGAEQITAERSVP